MKGGYRAGGGRPPGIIETRPRRRKKPSGESDRAKIREILSLGIKAKAKLYQELLQRIGRNEELTITEKKTMLKLHDELSAAVGEAKPEITTTTAENLDPLTYMLKIMNDPKSPVDRRDRMAVASAPFCHPRRGEAGTGKKEAAAERAKIAGSGKYASMCSPFRVVKP